MPTSPPIPPPIPPPVAGAERETSTEKPANRVGFAPLPSSTVTFATQLPGESPATSVVRSDFRHHVVENLYVVDGSVFPTSLGVNPSLTVYGIATHAARGIAAAKT